MIVATSSGRIAPQGLLEPPVAAGAQLAPLGDQVLEAVDVARQRLPSP